MGSKRNPSINNLSTRMTDKFRYRAVLGVARCQGARRLSPLIAACSSLASVGKVMALGCTVVSTVTRFRSTLRSAPVVVRHP